MNSTKKCWCCGKQGKIVNGEFTAYGCFYCSPIRLPLKNGIRKFNATRIRQTRKH
ncbi:MAG: hypothetical protein WC283_03850 [Candidatus Paceibacterota bacterium]